ncbi:MAG: hypothetical protein U1E53_01280 [Dongiaceae bacterium]
MDRYRYGDNRPGNASVAYVSQTPLRDIEKTLPLRAGPADWAYWKRWGYVIVKEAAPPENVAGWSTCSGSSRRWIHGIPRPGTGRSSATTR